MNETEKKSLDILYVDCETGGYKASRHALTSIAAGHFVLYPRTAGQTWPQVVRMSVCHYDIVPHPAMGVTSDALKIQGLTWSDLDDPDRTDEASAIFAFSSWLSLPVLKSRLRMDRGVTFTSPTLACLPIWAHNAPFDRDFYTEALGRQVRGWHDDAKWAGAHADPAKAASFLGGRNARWNCSRMLAEKLLGLGMLQKPGSVAPPGEAQPVPARYGPQLPTNPKNGEISVSLDALIDFFGLEKREGHTAIDDINIGAQVTANLLALEGWL